MIWFIYVVSLPSVAVLISYILWFFPSRSTKLPTKVITALTWLASFSTLILVPGDVAAALKGRKSDVFGVWWQFAYWTIFCLQVIILPIMQEFARSGEFTVKAKVMQAVKRQVYYYMILIGVGIIGVILVSIVFQHFSIKMLLYYGLACSNAFGLVVGMLLLGFGLVEIPKTVYTTACVKGRQRMLQNMAAKQAQKAILAQQDLSKYVQIVKKLSKLFNKRDPLKVYMDQVEDELLEIDQDFKPIDVQVDAVEMNYFDRVELAKLRQNLCQAMEDYEREKCKYVDLVTQYSRVVDVLNNQQKSCGPFEASLSEIATSSTKSKNQEYGIYHTIKNYTFLRDYVIQAEEFIKSDRVQSVLGHIVWLWKCKIRQIAMRVAGGFLGVVSLSVLFSEATMNNHLPNLSPGSHLLRLAAKPQYNEFLTELVCYLLLAYPIACAYFALCKMGKFKKYYLMVPKHTTAPCLIYNAQFYARFAAPLAFNFMIAIALPMSQSKDGIDIKKTAFYKQIGHYIFEQPVIGEYLTLYIPLLLIPYVILEALGVFNKLVALFLGQQGLNIFDDGKIDAKENIQKGQYLLNLEMEYLVQHGQLGILISNQDSNKYENAVAIMNKQQMSSHPSLESLKVHSEKSADLQFEKDAKQGSPQNENAFTITNSQNGNTFEYVPGQIAQQRQQNGSQLQSRSNSKGYQLNQDSRQSSSQQLQDNGVRTSWIDKLKQSAIEIQSRFQDRGYEQQPNQNIELSKTPNQSHNNLQQLHQQAEESNLDNIFGDIAKNSFVQSTMQSIRNPFKSQYQRLKDSDH